MFKKITLAAMAAASVCAFAQSSSTSTTTSTSTWEQGKWDKNSGDHTWDMDKMDPSRLRRHVVREMMEWRPADAVYFASWLDRLPADKEWVVLKAVANAHNNSLAVRQQLIADQVNRWNAENPGMYSYNSASGSSSTSSTGSMAGNADSTGSNYDSSIGYSYTSNEDASRAMRMVVSRREPRDVSYQEAYRILSAGLNSTEQSQLASLFMPEADFTSHTWSDTITLEPQQERGADILARYIAANASIADAPIYRSVYSKNMWLSNPPVDWSTMSSTTSTTTTSTTTTPPSTTPPATPATPGTGGSQ